MNIQPIQRLLITFIKLHGPIPAARCSSARARGNAKNYSYWGAAQYVIKIGKAGAPISFPVRAASSDRRARWLAERDTEALAGSINGITITEIGTLSQKECGFICAMVWPEAYKKRMERERNIPLNPQGESCIPTLRNRIENFPDDPKPRK